MDKVCFAIMSLSGFTDSFPPSPLAVFAANLLLLLQLRCGLADRQRFLGLCAVADCRGRERDLCENRVEHFSSLAEHSESLERSVRLPRLDPFTSSAVVKATGERNGVKVGGVTAATDSNTSSAPPASHVCPSIGSSPVYC